MLCVYVCCLQQGLFRRDYSSTCDTMIEHEDAKTRSVVECKATTGSYVNTNVLEFLDPVRIREATRSYDDPCNTDELASRRMMRRCSNRSVDHCMMNVHVYGILGTRLNRIE